MEDEWLQPIIKQFARSTSEFVKNKCDSEHRAGRMTSIEFNRAVRINSLIDSYAVKYNGKTAEIFRCAERRNEFIEIQDLIVCQTQAWKILGPMHLTNPYNCTISVHRFMSGGAVNAIRLDVIRRFCAEQRDAEPGFVADGDFDESMGLTKGDLIEFDKQAKAFEATIAAEENKSAETETAHSSTRATTPQSVTINAGNIIFPTSLSPIPKSPVPCNPAKKRKIEILEELAEGMKSMTANFSRLLEEVKEENRGEDDSFDVISEN